MPAASRGVQAAVAMATAQRAHHPAEALLLPELHLAGQDQRHGGLPRQVRSLTESPHTMSCYDVMSPHAPASSIL